MTPERYDAILRGLAASLEKYADELEVIDAMRPTPTPAVQHLLVSMRQCHLSLCQLIERGTE